MPIHEYKCVQGHTFEKLFLTFKAAEEQEVQICPQCRGTSKRLEFSTPYPALLLGNPEGYYKPSPTKRFSYKKVSSIEGNNCSGG